MPLTKTNVRFSPRPRSEIADAPVPPPLLTLGLVALPAMAGSSWIRSPRVALPVASIASRLMVVTGLAVSVSTRRMREPVTVTLSKVWVVSTLSADGVSCACAAQAAPSDRTTVMAFISGARVSGAKEENALRKLASRKHVGEDETTSADRMGISSTTRLGCLDSSGKRRPYRPAPAQEKRLEFHRIPQWRCGTKHP